MLVVQSLKIVDRYGKREQQKQLEKRKRLLDDVNLSFDDSSDHTKAGGAISGENLFGTDCLDKTSMITGAVIFLLAQLVIVILFALIWKRNHKETDKGLNMLESRSDSLSYMYDAGFARRVQ